MPPAPTMAKQPLTAMFDRQPPQSPEAEMSLLGAMVLDPTVIPACMEIVRGSEAFYSPQNGAVWNAIVAVWRKNQSGDLTMLKQTLEDADMLEQAGGVEYIVKLAEETPVASNAVHYAAIVRDKSALRRMIEACSDNIHALYAKQDQDLDELMAAVTDRLAKATSSPTARLKTIGLGEAERDIMVSLRKGERETFPTGIEGFDAALGGVPKSGVVTLLGYPSSGKTTLAIDIAVQVCQGGALQQAKRPVLVFSYEQSARRVSATALSGVSDVNIHTLLNYGQPQPEEVWNRIEAGFRQHEMLDFQIVEQNMPAPDIYREVAAVTKRSGPGVVMVDYVQNLPAWGRYSEQREVIGESMKWLQRIGRDMGWLVLCVSQIDKATVKDNRRPGPSDGLGASAIEHVSDMMISVWREHQNEAQVASGHDEQTHQIRKRKTEIRALKNKYGQLGEAIAAFDPYSMKFRTPTLEEERLWG